MSLAPSYETILAAVDLGAHSKRTLEAAYAFAERMRSKRIEVVHVVQPPPDWALGPEGIPTSTVDVAFGRTLADLGRLISAAPPLPGVTIEPRVVAGAPARELDAIARKIRADVTVIAAHRRGPIGRLALGSVAGTLLRLSASPLLIVGDDRRSHGPFKNVIAAIDLSPAARAVLAHAQAVTDPKGELTVLSCSELEQIMSRLPPEAFRSTSATELSEVLEGRYYAHVRTLVEHAKTGSLKMEIDVPAMGLAREAIVEAARWRGCDLLVIGTSGHRAWQRLLLGSTADWVVAHAPCPVFVCPIAAEDQNAASSGVTKRSAGVR